MGWGRWALSSCVLRGSVAIREVCPAVMLKLGSLFCPQVSRAFLTVRGGLCEVLVPRGPLYTVGIGGAGCGGGS